MIACPQCGKKLADSDRFCDVCGTKLFDEARAADANVSAHAASKRTFGYVMSSQKPEAQAGETIEATIVPDEAETLEATIVQDIPDHHAEVAPEPKQASAYGTGSFASNFDTAAKQPKQYGYVMGSSVSIFDGTSKDEVAGAVGAAVGASNNPQQTQNVRASQAARSSSQAGTQAAPHATQQAAYQQAAYQQAAYQQAAYQQAPPQYLARPPKNYKNALVVVSIVAAALVVLLGVMLGIKTAQLEEALELNETYQEALSAYMMNGNSSSGKQSKNSAETIAAYENIVSKLISDIKENAGSAAASVLRESNGSLSDVNGDGTDEMMLIYSPDGSVIQASICCTDSAGMVNFVTENLGALSDTEFAGVYSGTLDGKAIVCLVSTTVDSSKNYACEGTFYTVENGTIKKLHEFSCSEPADSSNDSYYIDGKKVTEAVFNKYLNALEEGECFYGTDTPGTSLVSLKNMLV